MVNYQNGKIYKIEDVGGNMCYIGSTTKDFLSKRMVEHRSAYKNGKTSNFTVFNIFETYGVENCRIVLIELFPCDTKDELMSREAFFIKSIPCVNMMIPMRTRAQYYLDNVELIAEKKKIYHVVNKERLQAKKSQVLVCSCGKTYTYSNKVKHIITKFHLKHIANIPLNI